MFGLLLAGQVDSFNCIKMLGLRQLLAVDGRLLKSQVKSELCGLLSFLSGHCDLNGWTELIFIVN